MSGSLGSGQTIRDAPVTSAVIGGPHPKKVECDISTVQKHSASFISCHLSIYAENTAPSTAQHRCRSWLTNAASSLNPKEGSQKGVSIMAVWHGTSEVFCASFESSRPKAKARLWQQSSFVSFVRLLLGGERPLPSCLCTLEHQAGTHWQSHGTKGKLTFRCSLCQGTRAPLPFSLEGTALCTCIWSTPSTLKS